MLDDFDYKTDHQVISELKNLLDDVTVDSVPELPLPAVIEPNQNLLRLANWPLYRVDPLVRHASALQAMHDSEPQAIKLSMTTAKQYNLVSATPEIQ